MSPTLKESGYDVVATTWFSISGPHLVAARDELAQQPERLVARAGAHDPVALAERPAQVACDRRQDGGLVVDDHDRRPVPPAVALARLLAHGGRHCHGTTVAKRAPGPVSLRGSLRRSPAARGSRRATGPRGRSRGR